METTKPDNTIYLKKYYPIEGREDFFKWVIMTPDGMAKDYKGDVMYFDEFGYDKAISIMESIKHCKRVDEDWVNSVERKKGMHNYLTQPPSLHKTLNKIIPDKCECNSAGLRGEPQCPWCIKHLMEDCEF
jgi:hypothetical protein